MRHVCLVVLLGVALAGCQDDVVQPGHPAPLFMFQRLVQDPVPSGVTNLEGYGETWRGYRAYLRFTATTDTINAILATGYKPTVWSKVSFGFELPDGGRNTFSPAWAPASIPNKQCYEAAVKNDWTHSGTHYLVIDRATGTVYFYGIGA